MIEPSFRLPDGVLWNVLSFWPPQRPRPSGGRGRTMDLGPGACLQLAAAGRATGWTAEPRVSSRRPVPGRRPCLDTGDFDARLMSYRVVGSPWPRDKNAAPGSDTALCVTPRRLPAKLYECWARRHALDANSAPNASIERPPDLRRGRAPLVVLQLEDAQARRLVEVAVVDVVVEA